MPSFAGLWSLAVVDSGLRASFNAPDCDAGCQANEHCMLYKAAPRLHLAGNCGSIYQSTSGVVQDLRKKGGAKPAGATIAYGTRGYSEAELERYRTTLGLLPGAKGMVRGISFHTGSLKAASRKLGDTVKSARGCYVACLHNPACAAFTFQQVHAHGIREACPVALLTPSCER